MITLFMNIVKINHRVVYLIMIIMAYVQTEPEEHFNIKNMYFLFTSL